MSVSDIYKHSSLYLVGSLARRFAGFLMIPLYTRYLTPADYGIIELVELFVLLAGIAFGATEITSAMVRVFYEQRSQKDRDKAITTGMASMASITLLIFIAGFFLANLLSLHILGSPKYASLVRIAFGAMLFSNLMEVGMIYQRVQQRAGFFVIFSVSYLVLNLALNIYLIAYAGMGVWGFAWSKLVSAAIAAVVLFAFMNAELRNGPSWQMARSMASFGGPLVFTSISVFFIHFADRFFLNHYASLRDVGVYALAYKFGFLVAYIVGEPFNNKWDVSFYAYAKDDNWLVQFAQVGKFLAFALIAVFGGLALLTDNVLALLTPPSFWAAATLVPMLALGYVFRQIGDFFRSVLFLDRRVYVCSAAAVTCACINLVLNIGLISRYGATGAALATLGTWAAYMTLYWTLAVRKHRIPYSPLLFAGLTASAGIVVWAGSIQSPVHSVRVWATDITLLLLFLIFAFWGYFSAEERRKVFSAAAHSAGSGAALIRRFTTAAQART